jgi:hypothetical protein
VTCTRQCGNSIRYWIRVREAIDLRNARHNPRHDELSVRRTFWLNHARLVELTELRSATASVMSVEHLR